MTYKLVFLDVGHGDSILLETPGNKVCIIDCNKYHGRTPVVDYLKKHNIKNLEFICITHPHADHFLGMLEVINCIHDNSGKINFFADCGFSPKELDLEFLEEDKSKYYFELYKMVGKLFKGKLIECKENTLLYAENGFEIRALLPDASTTRIELRKKSQNRERNVDLNVFSIVLQITYGNTNVLLLSDSNRKSQEKVRTNIKNHCSINVFKISHHGSIESYNSELVRKWKNTDQSFAIISAGCVYGCPASEVLKNLTILNLDTYATNSFDYSPVTTPTRAIPANESVLSNLISSTRPSSHYPAIKPYHGSIEVILDITGIVNVNPEVSRPPITV